MEIKECFDPSASIDSCVHNGFLLETKTVFISGMIVSLFYTAMPCYSGKYRQDQRNRVFNITGKHSSLSIKMIMFLNRGVTTAVTIKRHIIPVNGFYTLKSNLL